MKLKNGCEGRASGLICEIVNSVVDFPKFLRRILYDAGRRSTSRHFVARSRPLRGQTRLAPLAKRSTCSKSNSVGQGNFIFVRGKSGNFRNLFVAVAIMCNVTNSFWIRWWQRQILTINLSHAYRLNADFPKLTIFMKKFFCMPDWALCLFLPGKSSTGHIEEEQFWRK